MIDKVVYIQLLLLYIIGLITGAVAANAWAQRSKPDRLKDEQDKD